MLKFREWMEVKGYRGVSTDELRSLAKAKQTGQGYSAAKEIGGDVAFDSDEKAGPGTAGTYFSGSGQKKGYMYQINAPEDQVRPRYADLPDNSYKVVQPMKPEYVPTFRKLTARPPIQVGDMTIQQQPKLDKVRDTNRFLDRYNRLFGQGGN